MKIVTCYLVFWIRIRKEKRQRCTEQTDPRLGIHSVYTNTIRVGWMASLGPGDILQGGEVLSSRPMKPPGPLWCEQGCRYTYH